MAATTVATRVAEELRCKVGDEVGYSIRFEDVTSSKTRIKFMTDGMLLREALVDPLLSRYSIVMVDEAHERSLGSDILLGLLKKIRKRRPELRIIVSSATIEAERFATFFRDDDADEPICRVVSIEGRSYPVDVLYVDEPVNDYHDKSVETVFNIHTQEPNGDILVFLTGREEIETAIQKVSELVASAGPKSQALQPLPLYAGLTTEEQMYVFSPAAENTRKVIFATNIAEASVTIEGIVYVVDSGFVKLRAFNPKANIESLTAVPISKASATQRAGRAGRTKAGKCYRLYTEASYNTLANTTVPEIQRSNLAPIVLQLKALGIDNVAGFEFLTSPPSALLIRAFELLYALGAVDDYAKLTKPLGTRMAELSQIDAMMCKSLLSAPKYDCLSEMVTLAAMTSLQGNIWVHQDFSSRRDFAVEQGDHLTLLNIFVAFQSRIRLNKHTVQKWCSDRRLNFKSLQRASSIREQLKRQVARFGLNVDDEAKGSSHDENKSNSILRCLTTGHFAHAARFDNASGTFHPVSSPSTVMYAHPTSLFFNRKADYVIFSEVLQTGKDDKIFIRDISKIEKSWLTDASIVLGKYYSIK